MNILKFSAQWCMPCKMMKPIFKEVSKDEKYKNIDFIEIDIEDENLIKNSILLQMIYVLNIV